MQIFRHHEIKPIANYVKNGGVIVYPTDTVWGIGGNALNEKVVQNVKTFKGKPTDAKLIWLLPSVKAVHKYCGKVTELEKKMLLKKRTTVIIHDQAVRVVRSGWLNRLLTACGVPLVATSANLHGEQVVQAWRQAVAVFADKDLAVVRGRKIYRPLPSSLVKIEQTENLSEIKILRAGSGISMK